MRGPERFDLTFDSKSFKVLHPSGALKFSGLATSRLPKLYVASAEGMPIYVGLTKQSLQSRLRLGWTATGESGYHGYAWRHALQSAELRVWYHEDAPENNPCLDLETVEAEVVFLIRSHGQWPRYQTEIHFHQSTETHRSIAREILRAVAPQPIATTHEAQF